MNRRGFVGRLLGALTALAAAPAIAARKRNWAKALHEELKFNGVVHDFYASRDDVLRGGLAGETIEVGDIVMMAPNGIWFLAQSGMEHKHIGVALTNGMTLCHIDVAMNGVVPAVGR